MTAVVILALRFAAGKEPANHVAPQENIPTLNHHRLINVGFIGRQDTLAMPITRHMCFVG
jgi:hypothetical protein